MLVNCARSCDLCWVGPVAPDEVAAAEDFAVRVEERKRAADGVGVVEDDLSVEGVAEGGADGADGEPRLGGGATGGGCADREAACADWAAADECERNAEYMRRACCAACAHRRERRRRGGGGGLLRGGVGGVGAGGSAAHADVGADVGADVDADADVGADADADVDADADAEAASELDGVGGDGGGAHDEGDGGGVHDDGDAAIEDADALLVEGATSASRAGSEGREEERPRARRAAEAGRRHRAGRLSRAPPAPPPISDAAMLAIAALMTLALLLAVFGREVHAQLGRARPRSALDRRDD